MSKDTRVWMYRDATPAGDVESRIFPHPDAVPADEGWRDSPAKPAPKPPEDPPKAPKAPKPPKAD